MPTKKNSKPAPEFTEARDFIKQYSILPTEDDYDVATLWAMGTWTFSPASPAMPVTYPYLYLTGGKGSGKSHLGLEVFQYICRNHKPVVDITGAVLFRMLGDFDEESGEIIPHYPTLAIDEVDAIYGSGAGNSEQLRGVGNAGYKLGSTVPRAAGKRSIDFPVYCPKVWMGIDNGRLPDTLTDRCIRLDLRMPTDEQLDSIDEGPYTWDMATRGPELQQHLSDWAKRNAMVLRDYRPERIEGISPRQWEICRSLIQLARAAGIEDRIREALVRILARRKPQDTHQAMYQSIFDLFEETGTDRLTTRQILARLREDGVPLPGDSGKGLWAAMKVDGIERTWIALPKDHPEYRVEDGKIKRTARGYMRNVFDDAFAEYLMDEDEDDE